MNQHTPPALPPPLALYVHFPWCLRKCPYCDFNSHLLRGTLDSQGYVDALLADLDQELGRQPSGVVGSVFFGGGTPSLIDGTALEGLLRGIDARMSLACDAEITLEANPGTAEAARFAAYRAAGVNRLSLGVQSLDDRCLLALGRIHSADDARQAMRLARAAGFDNVNLDMMFGLPGQSLAAALGDLDSLIGLQPEHVSWYQLTLEPNTAFHHQPPALPDEDALVDMMDAGQCRLAEAGFRQYEISAYARPGRTCRHNRNYWEFGDYLGIGAGAHGKLTGFDGRIRRRSKLRQPAAYLAAAARGAVHSDRLVQPAELAVEFLLNALRLNAGVPAASFAQRTGLALEDFAAPLAQARARGLLEPQPERLCATPLGRRFLNELLQLFEPDPDR